MWIVASIPFWILGALFVLGAFAQIDWRNPTTDGEVKRLAFGLCVGGILLVIAAKIAS